MKKILAVCLLLSLGFYVTVKSSTRYEGKPPACQGNGGCKK